MSDQASKLRNLVEELADEEITAKKIGELDLNIEDETRVIAVTSGKGGVGKTNLAVNLAVSLQEAGKRVLLIDADIGMANVNVLMGRVTNRSLIDLLNDETELKDVVEEGIQGVKYISGAAGVEAALNVNRAAQRMIHRKLEDCSKLADIIIIDTGAGLNRYVIEFILAAHEVLLITTPEPTSLADAYAVVKAYSKYTEKRSMKLIVNRIRDESECKDASERLNQTTQKFLNLSIECLG
ncbi:MAG: AAA family ATPase, partial [Selenomonadaceae bacterium]|nr:AAA family ATPase [Selenomonadaceae bacterium]